MKTVKRSLLLLLCVAILVVGALVMSACSKECTHTWGDWSETTAATCIAEGTETRTCSTCGATEDRAIGTVAHNFSTYTPDGNATCQADGTKTATCTTEGCNAKDTVADTGSKTSHVFTNYTSNNDATCQADGTKTATCETEGCNATETVTDTGSKKSHLFTTYHSDNNATCQADGTKTATCDYFGCNEKDTVTDTGSKKSHSFTEYVSNDDATCVLDGTKTATCDFDGCNEKDTVEDEGSKLGHAWDRELTCTTGHVCTRTGCDAEEAALGHNYTVVGGTELTCEQDSTTIYACQNGCGDTFTVTNALAPGHAVSEWTFDHEEFIGDCTYVITYAGICANKSCGQTVYKTEEAERHTLKSTIDTDATCSVPGKKLISCTECSKYSTLENYTNPEAHTWAIKSVDGNVTTYECTGCHATKTAITATEDTETTVDKDTLESAGEVELKDASIALDKNTLDGLEGDVQISAGTLEGKDLEAVMDSLGGDKLAQIGDNPIYNFGLNDSNGAVSSFNGYVTIRVPYTLEEGEDVDSIAVWFINDKGEVESIEATYDNGYAVFSTNHFSYYTVTRLTPAERCELYGHSYKETVVKATCVSDGYTIKVCQRCGNSTKEITGKATGHTITTVTTPATCTESGSATHSCANCDYTRVEKIAPTGHTWGVTDSDEATCKKAGYTVYTCSTCQASYKTVIAQKAHSYTDTVTKATCTTDGYTTRVCEWCQHTTTTNKIAALGHDYKTTTVESGCTNEGYTLHDCSRCDASYKTDIIPPSHTWDIAQPTCGKGQICIVCGAGGQSATGEHTMENGICTVCGTGCKHTFNSVVTDPTCTEVGFTTNTCTACGVVEKTDYKPATGHTGALVCTVCGTETVPADFYTNILESLLNEQYTIVIDSLTLNDGIEIIDGEIFVSIADGLDGYGTVNVNAYGMIATFRAFVDDGIVYLCGENTQALTETNDVYMKAPLMTYMNSSGDMSAMGALVSLIMSNDAINWINDTLIPFVLNFAEDGKDEANLIAKTVVELICDVTEDNGNIVITPSIDKIKALNARLSTETIGEFVDKEFGAGAYDAIVTKVNEIFDLTLGEVIDKAKENGADVIALVDSIDALLTNILGENVTLSQLMELDGSIQDMLKSDEIRATTVEEIVTMLAESMGGTESPAPMPNPEQGEPMPNPGYGEGDVVIIQPKSKNATEQEGSSAEPVEKTIREYVIETLTQIKGMTAYEMAGYESTAENVKSVDEKIDEVFEMIDLTVKTDKNGTLISIDFAAKDFCDVSIVADYTSTFDYSKIKDTVNENTTFAPDKNYITGTANGYEYVFEVDENGKIVSVSYTRNYTDTHLYESGTNDNGNYEIYVVTQENSNCFAYLDGAIIGSHSDCGDWIGVYMMAVGTRTSEIKTYVEVYENGVLTQTIDDPEILGMLGIGSKIDSYEGLDMIDVEFFINSKTGEITSFGDASTLHEWEEDEAKHKPAVGCEGVGEYHYFCTKCGETLVVTYTNGHDYEWTYELKDGATSCLDGVIAKRVCTECGKVSSSYETNYHETQRVDIDLSGFGVCEEHSFTKYACPCGQSSGFIYGFDFEWSDEGSYCSKCGVIVKDIITRTPGEGCTMNEVRVIVITKNGATIYSETYERTYEEHDTRRIITLMPGATSCEEGIIVKMVCTKCGEVLEEYEDRYHQEYEKIIVDFSEYGSVCGGYIYTYGCACGEYKNNWIGVSSDCEFEETCEYWNEWCDHLYKYTCAVTSPACGFTYYRRAYFTETRCGRTCYEEYYVMKNGEKVILYSYITEENVYHNYEVSSESKTPVDGIPCFYLVSRIEKCKVCGYYNEFNGYEFQHSYNDHDDGYYCDVCGEGEYYEYDDEGREIARTLIRWYTNGTDYISYERSERRWMYYKGYQFTTFNSDTNNYYNLRDGKWEMSDSSWRRETYEYDFSGVCSVTRTFEDSYGKENYTDTYCACEYFNYGAATEATCTQHGVGSKTCAICGTSSTYEIDPICHEWIWYDYEGCYVCRYCGLKNANGASGSIVLEDASDLDEDDDSYIVGYYYRDFGDKFDIIYAITLINEWGDELAFIDLEQFGIEITPWGNGRYITFSKSAVMNAAKKLGYTEDQYDIRISFVPVGWESDLDYAITFEVMSATDECHHCYDYDGVCVFCGFVGNDKPECDHWYENGYCVNCGERDPYYEEECKHWYEGGKCIYCGMPEDNYGEECKHENVFNDMCIYCGYLFGPGDFVEKLHTYTHYQEFFDAKGELISSESFTFTLFENSVAVCLFVCFDYRYGEETREESIGEWNENYNGKTIIYEVFLDEWEPMAFYVNKYGEFVPYEGETGEECKHENIREEFRDATCSDVGFKRTVCDNCGGIINEEYIAPIGHQFDENGYCTFCGIKEGEECKHEKIREEYCEPTCSDMGFKRIVCDTCGIIINEEYIAPIGHQFDDKGYCMFCGYYEGEECKHEFDAMGKCVLCGYSEGGYVEGCKHEMFREEYCDPTCYDVGFKRIVCDSCGIIINEEYIAPIGHQFDDKGYCMFCGYYEGEECKHEFDAMGKCVLCGYSEGGYVCMKHYDYDMNGYCDNCGNYIGDIQDCKHPELVVDERPASCYEAGYKIERCTMCGTILYEEYFEPTEHQYGGGKCIFCGQPEGGETECAHKFDEMGYCVLCGYSEGGYTEECKHENIREEFCDATCSDVGFKRIVCNNCGIIINEEYIAPIGHQFDDKGYCMFCGYVEEKECNHEYVDGCCIYCKQPEESWGNGDDVIVETCKHVYDDKGYCMNCGQSIDENSGNDFVIVTPTCP